MWSSQKGPTRLWDLRSYVIVFSCTVSTIIFTIFFCIQQQQRNNERTKKKSDRKRNHKKHFIRT